MYRATVGSRLNSFFVIPIFFRCCLKTAELNSYFSSPIAIFLCYNNFQFQYLSMMKKIIKILIFAIGLVSITCAGITDEGTDTLEKKNFEKDGITFLISQVHVGEWTKETEGSLPESETVNFKLQQKVPMLAVTIDLINKSSSKKLDLTQKMQYELNDEFGNAYDQLKIPMEYTDPVIFPNKNYPSLYPNEKFRQTIFFEAPIKSSQNLNLSILAKNLGMEEEILLPLPEEVIGAITEYYNSEKTFSDNDLLVLTPQPGTKVYTGEVVNIEVKIKEGLQSPQSVYIISQDYTLEDERLIYKYKLKIPADQVLGPFTVLVIAKWNTKPEKTLLSKTILLEVIDRKKECEEACLNEVSKNH